MIDNTILVACNNLRIQQNSVTSNTLNLCIWLLDYLYIHPNPSITFKKSNMQYWISSNSSYLSVSKEQSRVGGYYFLGNIPDFNKPIDDQQTFVNTPFYIKAAILLKEKLLVRMSMLVK